MRFSEKSILDYADYAKAAQEACSGQDHIQVGDPAKLGQALVRPAAGSDAVGFLGDVYEARQTELSKWETLSRSAGCIVT